MNVRKPPSYVMKNRTICESTINYMNEREKVEDVILDMTKTNKVGSKTKSLFNKLISLSSMFNLLETQYNINNKYYYGYLPYLIADTFVNSYDVHDFLNEFTNKYIMTTYDFNYIDSDIAKIYLLIVCTIAVITDSTADLNDLISAYNNFIHCFNINNYYSNSSESDLIKNKKILKNISKAYTPFVENILAEFTQADEQSKTEKLLELRNIFLNKVKKVYTTLNLNNPVFKRDYNLEILINYLEFDCIDIDNYKSIYFQDTTTLQMMKNYIYTSLYIYSNNLIPPIESNDDGNGRLSEFLLAKVYSVLELFLIIQQDIISRKYINKLGDIYSEFAAILKKHNFYTLFKKSSKLRENTGFILLNITDFRIKYFNKFCSKKYIRTKNNNKNPFCYIDYTHYNEITDIYNKLNINTDYIIVKIDNDNITYNNFLQIIEFLENPGLDHLVEFKRLCIQMIESFNFLFKPLYPLCYYYSNIFQTSNPRNYELMNKNIYNKNNIINNCHIGGDLYCILNHNFYLIDSKRYRNVKNVKCLIAKTLIQSYLYMNVYYDPLCTINNIRLYKNYFVGIINPIDNFYNLAYYFDLVSIFSNNDLLQQYLFTDAIPEFQQNRHLSKNDLNENCKRRKV